MRRFNHGTCRIQTVLLSLDANPVEQNDGVVDDDARKGDDPDPRHDDPERRPGDDEAPEDTDERQHDREHHGGGEDQAVELRLEILEVARTKAKKIIETGTKGFEPELEKAQQTFKDDIAKDSKEAKQKIDEVVNFVVAKFEERLGKE